MADPKVMIAATALNKMFRGNHFSICTVTEVASMLGIHPEAEAMRMLQPLHCVHWSDMPPELRNQVPALVEQALAGGFQAFQVQILQPGSSALAVIDASPATRRPLMRRIFGGRSNA
jgi:hypothetical protein